jgi:hypothetical protein
MNHVKSHHYFTIGNNLQLTIGSLLTWPEVNYMPSLLDDGGSHEET